MFRHLIPLICDNFHVVAPDLPGFGFTEFSDDYKFTFDNIASTVELFLDVLKITKFAIYVFDYGAPVGFRLALRRPTSITAVIIQNGNAYVEGLDDRFWGTIRSFWKTSSDDPEFVKPLSGFIENKKNVDDQYFIGTEDLVQIEPTAHLVDFALLQREGQTKIQIALFYDYQNNLGLYPLIHDFLRSSDIPVLAVWGEKDYIFTPKGAEAYRRDSKNFRLRFFNAGHFALETHVAEIAEEINTFISSQVD